MDASMGKTSRSCVITLNVGLSLLLLQLLAVVDIACITLTHKLVSSIADVTNEAMKESLVKRNSKYRLPTNVEPVHYDLTLEPLFLASDPINFTYNGSVNIQLKCTRESNRITLNLDGPTVDESSIIFQGEKNKLIIDPKYVNSTVSADTKLFNIFLSFNMKPKRMYSIQMNFSGRIAECSDGLFYRSYKRGNETKYLVATDFEPNHARKVFPCFDEPAMKATFTLTLARPICHYSRSNTEKYMTIDPYVINGEQFVKDVYMTTPNMSTYSLAFVIFDYPFTHKLTPSGVNVTIFGTRNPEMDMLDTLDLATKLNDHFKRLFEADNPLKKIDYVGLTSDVENTANWGLNIFKQSALQYNRTDFNQEDFENMARSVAYGAVHAWIGNMVTPAWWDDLWLKEGLAGFFQQSDVKEIRPDGSRTLEFFIMDRLHYALEKDATVHDNPVYKGVEKPEEIAAMSNWVNSRKAPSLIRMLEFFLGKRAFNKGIKSYLKKYAYKAATHEDFFAEFTEAAKSELPTINVKDVMDTWILQTGYPVVTVSRDFNNNSVLLVKQERFLSDPTARDTSPCAPLFNYRWTIPLTFTFSHNASFEQGPTDIYWLDYTERTKLIKLREDLPRCGSTDDWILANVQQYGFYRVNYQHGNWMALGRQLEKNHAVIPQINRAQIINDAWHLTRAAYIPMDIALSTLKYLDNERDYLPWYTAWVELRYLNFMLSYSDIYGGFQKFMQAKLSKPFAYFGPPTTKPKYVDPFLRSLIIEQACYFGNETCATVSSKLYRDLMERPEKNKIPVNLRKAVYCQAIASGGWKEFKFALNLYQKTESGSAKDVLIFSMACSNQPWILNHYLHTLKDTAYTNRHAQAIIILVGLNPIGRYLSWDFYRVNYELLNTMYASLECRKMLPEISEYFNTEMELQEVIDFLLEACQALNTKPLARIVGDIKANIAWTDANIENLRSWLSSNKYFKAI